jgi:hypothetical protein
MPKKSVRRIKARTRKRIHAKKKNLLFFSRGNITLYLLLIIVILGAYLMVGGLSDFRNSPVDNSPLGEVINDPPGAGYDNLQLQTIRFKQCASQVTIDLLLDVSGSMDFPTETNVSKISRLKEAVSNLTNKMGDSSIIGIQTFRGIGEIDLQASLTDLVPISYYSDVKNTLLSKINSIFANGSTPTHDALAFSFDKLEEAQSKFPDRKFNFILISDGAPCPGVGCPDHPASLAGNNQDPREFTPNPANQIKDLGINVYTIGIYDRNQAKDTNLENLLIDTASKRGNYFNAGAGDAVKNLLNVIAEKICKETEQK